jgi:hypothetical protein
MRGTFEKKAYVVSRTRTSFRSPSRDGFVIVTADVEFGNELVYPPQTHHGVVLIRLPETLPGPTIVQMTVTPIVMVSIEDLSGAIIVVEPGRVRSRRPASTT